MSRMKIIISLLIQLLLGPLLFNLAAAGQGLQYGFYKTTCPNAESIVYKTLAAYFANDNTVAAPVLRLHFHDCFVRGCDGSLFLNSTKSNKAEKDADPNLTLDGFYVIDAAKAALEKECPGVVSCADISAIAARDSVYLSKGVHYEVQTGRRDGRVSLISEVSGNLPLPSFDFGALKFIFAAKGLSVKDLVLLSGAHTIGQSHCPSFANRIYNFTGKGDVDPSLDPSYVKTLRGQCKPGDTRTTVNMDPPSPTKFDTDYYRLVQTKRGLFHSDAELLRDAEAASYVRLFGSSQPRFFSEFAVSMVKMGASGVLMGTAGEIRKNCALVN